VGTQGSTAENALTWGIPKYHFTESTGGDEFATEDDGNGNEPIVYENAPFGVRNDEAVEDKADKRGVVAT